MTPNSCRKDVCVCVREKRFSLLPVEAVDGLGYQFMRFSLPWLCLEMFSWALLIVPWKIYCENFKLDCYWHCLWFYLSLNASKWSHGLNSQMFFCYYFSCLAASVLLAVANISISVSGFPGCCCQSDSCEREAAGRGESVESDLILSAPTLRTQ